MKYITLTRGNESVWYPIYELKNDYFAQMTVSPLTTSFSGVTGIAVSAVIPTQLPVPLQTVFADTLPETASDFGSILQTQHRYAPRQDDNVLDLIDVEWEEIPIGTKPDDWDTNFFDYFTRGYDSYSHIATITGTYPATQISVPPAWSSTTQYYKNVIDVRQRFLHVFKTGAGYTFGIHTTTGTGYAGYNKHYSRLGTLPGLDYNAQSSFLWRTPRDGGMDFYFDANQDWRVRNLVALNLMVEAMAPGESTPFNNIPLTDNRREFFGFICTRYNDVDYYGVMAFGLSSGGAPVFVRSVLFTIDLWGADSISDNPPEPEPQGGEWGESTQRAGGQGLHAATSDARGDRDGTTVRDIMSSRDNALALAFDTPFMRTYSFDNLSRQQIGEIFSILYGTDYWSMFQNQMLNPLSSIVAFHLIPSTLRGANLTLEDLIIGPKNISAAMTGTPQVTKIRQIKWYHIGTVDMSDVLLPYFDAYPDFAPYTDIILHLPYIGDIKIDVNAVMYGALSVEYACDNVSGNVAAWIYCEDRYPEPQTHKQYKYIATGNCAYSIPLFAQSQNGMDVGKIIGSGIGIVGGVATGNLAAAVSGAMGIGSALYEHSRAPITTQQTGGSSGNVAILGDTDVWIEVIRPQWIQPESYQQLVGIPSGISGTLSEIGASGRVVCSDIETDGIAATEPELREIERLLLSGIYLKPQT